MNAPHPAWLLASAPAAGPAQPKAPVLGWRSFALGARNDLPAVDDLRYRAHTTSGRAALAAALTQRDLPPGAGVLVPSYHCPTMVAPVVRAGLEPLYFPIDSDGRPALDAIPAATAARARVMFVAHYFGLPRSLRREREWCDRHGIVLVEDCAHSFFGVAGERAIGSWGDYAIASISKFFPVSEAGVLASAHHPLVPPALRRPTLRAQIKGVVDPLETALLHGRLAGPSHLLGPALWLKRRARGVPSVASGAVPAADIGDPMAYSDMARVGERPTWGALALYRLLPRGPIVRRRRANYLRLAAALRAAAGARLLAPELPAGAAPYVCPLWVEGDERADRVYARLKDLGMAVFRWEHLWPGTPRDAHDVGVRWSRQVIQLLCHQDLTTAQIEHAAATALDLLATG